MTGCLTGGSASELASAGTEPADAALKGTVPLGDVHSTPGRVVEPPGSRKPGKASVSRNVAADSCATLGCHTSSVLPASEGASGRDRSAVVVPHGAATLKSAEAHDFAPEDNSRRRSKHDKHDTAKPNTGMGANAPLSEALRRRHRV